ncbi:MAG TPA: DMT family transporter [Pseudolabrys sp.]|jgi:drug/metabolite transporter (DMT)-like permease
MSSAPSSHHVTRPLDAVAAAIVIVLCLSWGFNQVAAKLAIHDIPPMIQAAIRSFGAALIVAAWAKARGIPLLSHDGTLLAGLAIGAMFSVEFILIYRGLLYTTASRAVLFVYTAPFFVVLGARWFLPADRFHWSQWTGLALSFAGLALAFGLPTPAADPRQMLGDFMMLGGAIAWAATTLLIKASSLNRISAEKVMLYQLVVSGPVLALAALVFGEHMTAMPSALALGALAYQTVWVVSVTFVVWFALVMRYSANRLSAFTFLTPLFGVAAGHLVLGEPLTPAFAAAVVLVAGGLVLVNRAR